MDPSIRELLRSAGEEAFEMGFSAYIVGGLVRDLFLGRKNDDVDLVIEGDGISFARKFARKYDATLKCHERFGTASLVLGDQFMIDIATARLESYERPAALPRVRPGTIRDDLKRRDFTVNALAIALHPGEFGHVLDSFDARRDICNRRIRVLHDRSFIDDPTRIFRAVRFEQRLGFRIVRSTERLIREALAMNIFAQLEPYRVAAELHLIQKENEEEKIIKRLETLGVFKSLWSCFSKERSIRKYLEKIGGTGGG